ncbi:phosphoglucosamine mutase [Alkanindiges hydrocarboniclasticus]|jgi:phosphoglucosamine mutase|uniref:Phosphoglucosamine mutase n=1 Tax=Alkanindiges hydrocarboniclasticus TaxID=1907941 RepID=A0A1S8CU42_9GAMM|nr:phosphoglucosamine mutase [Alkanindiges hydrocarboniclasticus]ONG40045.1 phosphoglucosamine mutase [Alkanindiges hydrocarboniclasticus]
MSHFGTDGIRGKFGEDPITPEFALKLGFAAGRVFASQARKGQAKVMMGKDTRLSGYVLEAALQAGLNAAGVDVLLLGPLPTPAIAHLTRAFHANAGIVISASHNPYFDNGIKFFSSEGKKLPDELQNAISAQLEQPIEITAPDRLGKSYRIKDSNGRYIEFCKSSFPYHLNLTGLKIVIDCANGAGYMVGPAILRELGATVIALHSQPDGLNINADCGSTHPESLQKAVLDYQADVGIALDGDADRIIMVDQHGKLVDGDAILYILATQAGCPIEGVVGTLMSNMGLELALKARNIDFKRAKVGDRYVMADLETSGWQIGGEPSGHILCLDKSTTGDALICGLQVLAQMVAQQKALHELTTGLSILPQALVNVRLAQMIDPYADPALSQAFDEAEAKLAGRGRLLIRKSGTEPVIRVMVEGETQEQVDQLANELADLIRSRGAAA